MQAKSNCSQCTGISAPPRRLTGCRTMSPSVQQGVGHILIGGRGALPKGGGSGYYHQRGYQSEGA